MRWISLALFASLALLASPAAAQTDPAVKDFKRYFKKAKETVERVEFVRSLEKIDDPGVAKELLKVLKDKEPAVAAAAAEVLAQLPSPEARAPMLEIVEKGKPAEQLGPILRCAAKGKWEEFLPLLRPHLEHKEDGVRLWAVRAVGNMNDEESLPQIVTLAGEDPNPLVRVAAIESIVQMGKPQLELCMPPLLAGLKDEDTSVQVASCLAFRTLRHKDAIPALIDTWQNGEGLVLQHIYPTLLEITDLQFGADAEQWGRWWENAQERFEIPSDAKLAERRGGPRQDRGALRAQGRQRGLRRHRHTQPRGRVRDRRLGFDGGRGARAGEVPPGRPHAVRQDGHPQEGAGSGD